MVLGMMSDLDEYVDEALAEVSDWELNFKVGMRVCPIPCPLLLTVSAAWH
jgi:hypothetical protein